MGPPQASTGHPPEVSDIGQPLTDEDRHTITLVASLCKELVDLQHQVDSQECSVAHAKSKDGEDKDKQKSVKCHLCSSRQIMSDTLPD